VTLSTDADDSELRMSCAGTLDRPKVMRHALAAFMTALEVSDETRDDILTAVGEALANAVEHAHEPGHPGRVALTARFENAKTMMIEVEDDGTFVDRGDEPRPHRGFGLEIIGAIARDLTVDLDGGTRVRMRFELG